MITKPALFAVLTLACSFSVHASPTDELRQAERNARQAEQRSEQDQERQELANRNKATTLFLAAVLKSLNMQVTAMDTQPYRSRYDVEFGAAIKLQDGRICKGLVADEMFSSAVNNDEVPFFGGDAQVQQARRENQRIQSLATPAQIRAGNAHFSESRKIYAIAYSGALLQVKNIVSETEGIGYLAGVRKNHLTLKCYTNGRESELERYGFASARGTIIVSQADWTTYTTPEEPARDHGRGRYGRRY